MSPTRPVLTQGCWYPRSIPGSQVACPQVSSCVPGLSGWGFPCPLRARRCWDPSGRIRSPSVCSFWLTLLLFFLHPGASVRQPRSGCAGGLRGQRVCDSVSPVLGLRWWLWVQRWGPGVGGCRGYPRILSRVLAGTSVPILLLVPRRQGHVSVTIQGSGGTPSTGV